MTSATIRVQILKFLYEVFHTKGPTETVHRDELMERFHLAPVQVDAAVAYLKEKGFVKTERYAGESPYFDTVLITAAGIDEVEARGER